MASTLDLIITPFADTGDKTAIPQTDPTGFVNFAQGYTPNYEIDLTAGNPQAKAVERQVQNYLFNQMTMTAQHWQRLGYAPWYNSMPGGYKINARVVRLNGANDWIPYRSLVNNNATDPLSSPASWEYEKFDYEIIASIPMQAGGTAGSTAELVTVATGFNTFGTGTYEFQTDAIAAASSNAPVGSAGMLECKTWANGGVTYAVQRYFARTGRIYARTAASGAWGSWFTVAHTDNVAMAAGGTNPANERVTVATDFNTMGTGTFEYISDTVANGSANKPSAYAGMLEVKQWTNGAGSTYTVQRYTDRLGAAYLRTGNNNGTTTTWTVWFTQMAYPLVNVFLTGVSDFNDGAAWTNAGWERAAKFNLDQAIEFDGNTRKWGVGAKTDGKLYHWYASNELTTIAPVYYMTVETNGTVGFAQRPTFAGQVPWDAGNFTPSSKQDALGYTPVQQGGGAGQDTNKIYIGWDGTAGKLKAQVDVTDKGNFVFEGSNPTFTGTPTVPTPGVGDNSTKIANTAHVFRDYLAKTGGNLSGYVRVGTDAVGSANSGGLIFTAPYSAGGSFSDWSNDANRKYPIQVDAPNNSAAYGGIRWTKWGTRHLAAIDAYSGGSDATAPWIGFHVGTQTNAWMFGQNDITRGQGGTVYGTWNFNPATKITAGNSATTLGFANGDGNWPYVTHNSGANVYMCRNIGDQYAVSFQWSGGQLHTYASGTWSGAILTSTNYTNWAAPIGGRVQWDSGVIEIGPIYQNYDLPAPYVTMGVRGGSGAATANFIYNRGVVLRNY